jgi:hypothetical protein
MLMCLLIRGGPREGEGKVSLEPCSGTMATTPACFSTPDLSHFPKTYFPYESLPIQGDGSHDFDQVATDAGEIRSDRMVLLGVLRAHQHTAKTKGECHWGACLSHEMSSREQAMRRSHPASGMQAK